jgi:ferritin
VLTETMVAKLNEQVNLEFYSSNLYLQMSSWCEKEGFEGSSNFLKMHAEEEMGHMRRLFNYVNETGAMAELGQIEAPPTEFTSLVDVFEKTYEHEVFITGKINELVHTAFEQRDYSTFNFLQWYVAEQHEEEKLFKSVLDKAQIIGADGQGLFFLDREIGGMAAAPPAAAE